MPYNPIIGGLIGGGIGLISDLFKKSGQKKAEKRSAEIEAAKTLYSPWTRVSLGGVKDAEPFSPTGMLGAGAGTFLQMEKLNEASRKQDREDKLLDLYRQALGVGGVYGQGLGGDGGELPIEGPGLTSEAWDALRKQGSPWGAMTGGRSWG